MRGDVLKQLRKACGFPTQAALAKAANGIDVRSVIDAAHGREVTVTTAVAIHKAFAEKNKDVKYEDLLVVPIADLHSPSETSIAQQQIGIAATVVITNTEIILKIAAPPLLMSALQSAQWEQLLKELISTAAKALVKRVTGGSIILTIDADAIATKDLIDSFLAWRLQYIGAHEMLFLAPHALNTTFANLLLSHFAFRDADMYERCNKSVLSREDTKIATRDGVHFIHVDPPDVLCPTDTVNIAHETARAAAEAAGIAWREQHRPNAWYVSNEYWQAASDRWQIVASNALGTVADAAQKAANAARIAAESASTAALTSSVQRHLAADSALEAAEEAAMLAETVWNLEIAPWESDLLPPDCHLWRLRSTLVPAHIREADQYWRHFRFRAGVPREATFPDIPINEPQPAVLLDDTTFVNQPQHQPL